MKPIPILLVITAFLCGCATGTKYTFDQVSQVKVGMKKAEVLQILPPATLTNQSSGLEVWVWKYDKAMQHRYSSIVFRGDTVLQVPTDTVDMATLKERQASAQTDESLGRKPLILRQEYVNNHPDMPKEEREAVLSGALSFETAEQMRLSRIHEQELLKQMADRRAEQDKAREEFIDRQDVPKPIRDAVAQRRVIIGMTPNQVKLVWGTPKTVNTSISAAGSSEIWSYGSSTLSFEHGRVSSINQTITTSE